MCIHTYVHSIHMHMLYVHIHTYKDMVFFNKYVCMRMLLAFPLSSNRNAMVPKTIANRVLTETIGC